jgi:hypothetical protein
LLDFRFLIGYAGIQMGITFLICYVGLAPSTDVYRPLWRFWGIVLGVLTTGFVFLWPEYASDKMIEGLDELAQETLDFAKQVSARSISERGIAAVEQRLSRGLLEVLNLAGQARLEGRRASVASAAGLEAASLLTRIAYRFQTIAHARLAGSDLNLPHQMREYCAGLEQEYCSLLEAALDKLKSAASLRLPPASALTPGAFEITSNNKKEAGRPAPQRIDWEAFGPLNSQTQLEAYRRLPILLARLDAALSTLVPPETA